VRQPVLGDRDHPPALVERDDVPREVPRQEAGPAGDVERAPGGQAPDERDEVVDLLVPAGARAAREQPGALVPVVVLGGAALVVGGGGGVAGEGHVAIVEGSNDQVGSGAGGSSASRAWPKGSAVIAVPAARVVVVARLVVATAVVVTTAMVVPAVL